MIKAQVVADSLSPQGDRLTSLLITFPRIILAEVNTHRMLSKNTASSRAIPFNKMVEAVRNNPFIPIAWQKEHKGMQGTEYFNEQDSKILSAKWLKAIDRAIESALDLAAGIFTANEVFEYNGDGELIALQNNVGVTKQLCNRLLEPCMWTTMLITGSKEGWDNFFELRCPQYNSGLGVFKSWKDLSLVHSGGSNNCNSYEFFEGFPVLERLRQNKGQAEIHMMALAEAIYDAMNESTPKQLKAEEWHIPFEDRIDVDKLLETYIPTGSYNPEEDSSEQEKEYYSILHENLIKISTAMAARTSYTVVGDEREIDYKKLIELHDKLIIQKPLHASPMEHCARAMNNEEYYSFIKGELSPIMNEEFQKDFTSITGITPIAGGMKNENLGWCRNFKGFIQYRHILENEHNTRQR